MSGSARLRDSPRSGLIAAALCVLATAAVLITAPAVHSALHSGASGRQPLAPRLAALSDQELAQLLPKQTVIARRTARDPRGRWPISGW